MDERGAHYTAMVVALGVPVLAFLALQRPVAHRQVSGSGAPMQVVLVANMPPPPRVQEIPLPPAQKEQVIQRTREPSRVRAGDMRPDPHARAGAEDLAGTTLNLRLPERETTGFRSSAAPSTRAWQPSLPRLRVRMEDASFGGRLGRMQKAATCSELRMMLDGPGGSAVGASRELVMRELRELGCLRRGAGQGR
ncbi:hypothetical protein LY625_05795 [Lysobacter sp. GX 14042]|uniref:hypothetical protein n=1 Tax=Lysobacter sp. GX 14042 TaxID=2907155 RepID=UPI001F16AFBE|nr:hypothetical protein [Lysobacter sp. GX 14042]MCE7032135.1 hypothetical protein [Lysobacter sp. GX 14042]